MSSRVLHATHGYDQRYRIYIGGRLLHDCFAALPGPAGWADVYEHEDGDNFTLTTGVVLNDDGPGLKQKRLYGNVTVKKIP